MGKEDRGFASMDPAKRREIASKGGRAAHAKGTAHEWTREEACEAGRKGGRATKRRRLMSVDANGNPVSVVGAFDGEAPQADDTSSPGA